MFAGFSAVSPLPRDLLALVSGLSARPLCTLVRSRPAKARDHVLGRSAECLPDTAKPAGASPRLAQAYTHPSPLPAAWRAVYPKATDDAIDLMLQLMAYDPDKRLTPEAGLTHAYCVQFHDAPTEVACDQQVAIHHSDNKKYKTDLYRESLYGLVDKRYQKR